MQLVTAPEVVINQLIILNGHMKKDDELREEFEKEFRPFIAYKSGGHTMDLGENADIQVMEQLEHCEEKMIDWWLSKLKEGREEMEANLENSAWAKAHELMVRDALLTELGEGINKIVNPYTGLNGDERHDWAARAYWEGIEQVLSLINQKRQ